MKKYILLIAIILFVYTYIIQVGVVPSESMNPTIKKGSFVVSVNTDLFGYKRGDIVVVVKDNEKLIKRVVGIGGDILTIKNGKIIRNGEVINSDYASSIDFLDFKVPEGSVFLLGDNGGNSIDSRVFGVVNDKDVIGKAILY